MKNAKRWYIYLTSGISLHIFTWGLITLLRQYASNATQTADIAFQYSIIIIALPMFAIHYFWADKLAKQDHDERQSDIRNLFFYIMLFAFLSPLMANTYTFLASGIFQQESIVIIPSVIAIAVTGIGYGLIYQQLLNDRKILLNEENTFFRRIFILFVNFISLVFSATAATNLLIFTFVSLWKKDTDNTLYTSIINFNSQYDSIAQLILSVTTLIIFWKWLQRLYISTKEEQQNPIRKIYLYLVVFFSAITTISVLTGILAGVFRQWMGLDPEGDIRRILPIAIVGGLIWAFHSFILNKDDAKYGTVSQQLDIKIIYLYLIASVGLMAFLIGVAGNLNTILSILMKDSTFLGETKEQFAYFTAAIISGLPTWIIPWRILQLNSKGNEALQTQGRKSTARKNYLYFYLFLAAMIILGSAVSIVYRFILLFLGESVGSNMGLSLSTSITNSLIAGTVLAYHLSLLNQDQKYLRSQASPEIDGKRIIILDNKSGTFAKSIKEALGKQFPNLNILLIGLSPEAVTHLGSPDKEESIIDEINNADLIVGDWSVSLSASPEFSKVSVAIRESKVEKLYLPINTDDVKWIGVQQKSIDNPTASTIKAIKNYLSGEEINESKGVGCFSIGAGIIILWILLGILIELFSF